MRSALRISIAGAVALAAVLGTGALSVSTAHAADTSVTYRSSTASMPNPERGLYHHKGDCNRDAFSQATLTAYRTQEHISLVMCIFYLSEFKTSAISDSQLAWFDKQAAAVRGAGLKMVVRFAYTKSEAGDDAKPSQVLAHIDQLSPRLRANSDVIDVVQSGFVGAWGEGYYTQNFGNAGVLSATNWADRKAVIDKLLTAVPATRMVQVRTPQMKRHNYGTAPVASNQAYGATAVARVGHHNDCFLASRTDSGTYVDPATEYPYLQADSRYVAVGGETCRYNPPRSDCPTALSELAMFHYSYLNRDYRPEVLDSWATGGCLSTVAQRLGYRYELTAGLYPSSVARGSTMLVQFGVRDTGFATAHNPRPVFLVLRSTASGAVSRVRLSTDPRRWTAGTTTSVAQNVGIPSTMAPGTYDLLLSLPDPTSSLAARPEYAIRLANDGVWEPATGLNSLLARVTIQ
jgi:hypothetical protein